MPDKSEIVINTGPLIALTAALDDFGLLGELYSSIYVPYEVAEEIRIYGADGFAVKQVEQADCLKKAQAPVGNMFPLIKNSLDIGEAAVIQSAINEGIKTVCIDETVGRRIARLSGLKLTGSLGILLKAKREGYPVLLNECIMRMRERGIWLSDRLVSNVLEQAGE